MKNGWWIGILVLSAFPRVFGEGFQAAVEKVEITPETSQWLLGYPPRKSTEVHDPIFHRILVLQHPQGQRFVLVSSDLCALSPAFYEEGARLVEARTGIEREQFWWTVTHTHSAPEVGSPGLARVFLGERFQHEWDAEYAEKVTRSLLEGIERALQRLAPARLAVGAGQALANINRRARDVEGKIYLGMNPYGAVDRRVGLLRVDHPDGRPLALLVNYAMHGTFLAAVTQISGDAPGIVASYLEEKLGAPVLYINGAAGNLAPLYSFERNFRRITQMNVLLGEPILQANQSLQAADTEVFLEATEVVLETPKRRGLAWPEELQAYLRQSPSGQELVRVPLRFLKLRQDTVLWAAPLELFCELAIQIRNRSPFPHTLYFGYTNGWLGYYPTAEAIGEGGYEVNVSPFTEQAEADLVRTVTEILHGLR